jgi:hypothetical protein
MNPEVATSFVTSSMDLGGRGVGATVAVGIGVGATV